MATVVWTMAQKFATFCQGIKSPELEAAVDDVWAQPEMYGTDFDATMSYLCQRVTKNSLIMQFVHIVKIGRQPVRPLWERSSVSITRQS